MNNSEFVICIENVKYSASLEKRKLYEVLLDPDKIEQIRVIDESGDD